MPVLWGTPGETGLPPDRHSIVRKLTFCGPVMGEIRLVAGADVRRQVTVVAVLLMLFLSRTDRLVDAGSGA